ILASDWSSDVCSSALEVTALVAAPDPARHVPTGVDLLPGRDIVRRRLVGKVGGRGPLGPARQVTHSFGNHRFLSCPRTSNILAQIGRASCRERGWMA